MEPKLVICDEPVPVPDPAVERAKTVQILSGDMPSPIDPPAGCVFHTRCPMEQARCASEVPALRALGDDTSAACHFA